MYDSRRRTDYYDSRRRTDYSRRRSSWDSDYDYSRRRSSYSADVGDNKPLKQSVWIPLVVIFAGIPVLASLIVFCWMIYIWCGCDQPEFSSHSVSHRTVSRQNRSTHRSARNDRIQTRPQFSIRIQPTTSTTRLSENGRTRENNNRTVETSLNTSVTGTAAHRSTTTRNVTGESTITGDHGSVDPNRLTPTADLDHPTGTDESIKTEPPTYSSLNRTTSPIPDSTPNNLPPPSYKDLFSDK